MAEHTTTSTGGALQVIVVTPEETALQTHAQFVALPLFDGELGVAPGRAPLIGRLGFGELRLTIDGKVSRYYVDGGFVQVLDNTVTLLTGRAIPAAQVNGVQAAEQLQAALARPAPTPEALAVRDRAILQARAQIRIAGHSTATAH